MKTNRLTRIMAIVLSAAIALPFWLAAPVPTWANNNPQPQYKLVDLGTFGGPQSNDFAPLPTQRFINSRGAVVGYAGTSNPDPYNPNCFFDCFVAHAFVWQKGTLTDLGALGDPKSNSSVALWVADSGLILGFSENGAIDPLTGNPAIGGVLWKDGKIIDLGTLGGAETIPEAVNNRGQVVGGALNTIPDPFSPASLVVIGPSASGIASVAFPGTTQMHAFLWDDGDLKDLGTLGGPDSYAVAINERGQIIGESYINSIPNGSTGVPTQDPFLWDDGSMIDLGNLGGTLGAANALNNRGEIAGTMSLLGDATFHPFFWERGELTDLGTFGGNDGEAYAINDAGDVVGRADLAGSGAHHGFFWRHGKMTEIGTVAGDPCSAAYAINSSGQVVGGSGHCGLGRLAILWENGSLFDLNSLVSPLNTGVTLEVALSINDRGEIVAIGKLANGNTHAFLLIPIGDDDSKDADAWSAKDPGPSDGNRDRKDAPCRARTKHDPDAPPCKGQPH